MKEGNPSDKSRRFAQKDYLLSLHRGYELYAGVPYKKEIDFVAIKRNEKLYIQVASSIDDPNTLQREVIPLLKIKNVYLKMILTRTRKGAINMRAFKSLILLIGRIIARPLFDLRIVKNM